MGRGMMQKTFTKTPFLYLLTILRETFLELKVKSKLISILYVEENGLKNLTQDKNLLLNFIYTVENNQEYGYV